MANAMAAHNQGLVKSPSKALRSSDRAVKTVKIEQKTRVVKAMVCAYGIFPDALTKPPGKLASRMNNVAAADTTPTKRMPNHIRRVMTRSLGGRGDFVITAAS